jgi:hypothetical protein
MALEAIQSAGGFHVSIGTTRFYHTPDLLFEVMPDPIGCPRVSWHSVWLESECGGAEVVDVCEVVVGAVGVGRPLGCGLVGVLSPGVGVVAFAAFDG